MNERIRIPILEGMPTSFGSDRPFDHITREIELGTQQRYHKIAVEKWIFEENPMNRAIEIGARIAEAVHTDQVKKETQSNISFTSVPKGIRASILCRMFGKDGEEAPRWWPEWLRSKINPQMKEIMTSYHANTKIYYQRVCPHQGEQGHGNFLFGPELTFASLGMEKDLYTAVERSRGDDFMAKIYNLITACRRNQHEPTLISLGRREMSLLIRSDRFGDMREAHHQNPGPRADKGFEIMGLKVEEVDKDTYLSIV